MVSVGDKEFMLDGTNVLLSDGWHEGIPVGSSVRWLLNGDGPTTDCNVGLKLGNLLGCFDDEGPKVPYIEGLKDGFDDGKIDSLGKVVGTADGSFDASLDGRKDGVMLGTPEG